MSPYVLGLDSDQFIGIAGHWSQYLFFKYFWTISGQSVCWSISAKSDKSDIKAISLHITPVTSRGDLI